MYLRILCSAKITCAVGHVSSGSFRVLWSRLSDFAKSPALVHSAGCNICRQRPITVASTPMHHSPNQVSIPLHFHSSSPTSQHTSPSFLAPSTLNLLTRHLCGHICGGAWRTPGLYHRLTMSFSTDVFVSSPPRPRTFDPISISSSSPYLPSLDEIFLKENPKNPRLRAGNPTTPIPANARATFTSAADILREAPEIDIDTETITRSPSRRAKITTKSPRRKTPTPDSLFHDRDPNQPMAVIGSLSPKDKSWQKYKTKPSTHHGNQSDSSSTYRNTVTSKKLPGRAKETVSRHFAKRGGGSLRENNDNRGEDEDRRDESADGARADTPSELAVPRRGDWTPPRTNEPTGPDSDSDSRELFSSAGKGQISKDVFQTLCNQNERQDPDRELGPIAQPQVDVLRKRKRIELISIRQEDGEEQLNEASLSKTLLQLKEQKSTRPRESPPKRRTRTITELALAPFAAPLAPDLELAGPATGDSMLDYFDADGAVKALVEHQSAVMSQRKPKAKATKPPPKTRRKKKAGTQANPILLSPSSALKQSSNQDFVFGTSSQLVQEESPTTLRDIQTAIRASNSLNSDPFDDDGSQRLWHAGARDEDGELMEMEVIDLRHGAAIMMEPNLSITPGGRSFVDINDILNSPGPVSSAPIAALEFGPANSHFFQSQSAEQCSGAKPSEPEGSTNVSGLEPRPKYELFTDAQLSKQITSYGFKPVKQRAAMIALLDQCWASKHQGAPAGSIQPLSTSARSSARTQQEPAIEATTKAAPKPRARGRPKKDSNIIAPVDKPTPLDKPAPKRPRVAKKKDAASIGTGESSTAVPSPKRARAAKKKEAASTSTGESSPKRPRGRPRKSSAPSVEIPDSDNETPSPISSPDPVFSSPPPLDLTMSDEGDMSLTLSPTDKQTELFRHITQAVTSAPRSQDPSKPSWHEKMLLYDPIILEDLASWLNSGELTRIGYDGEVAPVDVKRWCESKSVICLWRQNLRGRERKRC
ncbi:hypothetical protein F5B18DRAFT_635183 [Nemania serpens]|nr:hypothetical protein F5B18DRAFT_635183 [Nemania serpens]